MCMCGLNSEGFVGFVSSITNVTRSLGSLIRSLIVVLLQTVLLVFQRSPFVSIHPSLIPHLDDIPGI